MDGLGPQAGAALSYLLGPGNWNEIVIAGQFLTLISAYRSLP
jgi:hypothetical protein